MATTSNRKLSVTVFISIVSISAATIFSYKYFKTKEELITVTQQYHELIQLNASKEKQIETNDFSKQYDSEIETVKRNLNSNLRVVTDGFDVKPLGGIYNAYIKVINNTDYQMESIEMRVSYLNDKGAEVDYLTGPYFKIPPNSTKRIKIRDSKRGTQLKTAITKVYCSALGLN